MEPPVFWHLINGKMEFKTIKAQKIEEDTLPARLFLLSLSSSGVFHYEECLFFSQDDLRPEYYMLLDCKSSVIIWRGTLCRRETYHMVNEMTSQYLESDFVERDPHTCFQMVKQGFEPPLFTGFFENWNKNYWDDYKTYDELRAHIQSTCRIRQSKNNNH